MKALAVSLLLLSVLVRTTIVYAQWRPDGTPLSTAPSYQTDGTIVSDGAGGAIVAWMDARGATNYDIYAQRLNASGVVQWTTDGVPLCTAAYNQLFPTIVSDGSGGATVTWHDLRTFPIDHSDGIYAQRVNASGEVLWTADGIALCTASGGQDYPKIVSDGSDGAIVTWQDHRSGLSDGDIYAQRVDASGVVQWTPDGVAVCTATHTQEYPEIVSDGAGGVIAAWHDWRNGIDIDVYAQRIDGSGVMQWLDDGVAICTAVGNQGGPRIVWDEAGMAIVTWTDGRNSTADIYAQQVSASGLLQWTPSGVAVCADSSGQGAATVVSDGAGGAIVTWLDYRGSAADIYAQRVNESGAMQWTADGVAVCTAASHQAYPTIASDGNEGAIVTWIDYRNGATTDIYVQRIDRSGVMQWTADGVPLCTAVNNQEQPRILSDGAEGVIVAWQDDRSGSTNTDIYAQRVEADGTPTGVEDAPAIHALSALQNHPNPFGGGTEFEFELLENSDVRIEVFDVMGQRVRTIEAGDTPAGWRTIEFAGDDDAGRPLVSGVYFYRVTAGGGTITRKMVLVR